MNNLIFVNTARFIGLVLIQVLVFNHINLFGYINPLIYITWVFLFPVRKNITPFLLLSFLLGLSIDFFSDSGGINAAATTVIAFIRLPLLKTIIKKDFDYVLFSLRSTSFSKAFSYITISTFIHHFIVFSLAYFNFEDYVPILSNTLVTSIFTIVTILLGLLLFTKKK